MAFLLVYPFCEIFYRINHMQMVSRPCVTSCVVVAFVRYKIPFNKDNKYLKISVHAYSTKNNT